MHRLRSAAKRAGQVLAWLAGSVFLLALAFYLFENRAPGYRILTRAEIAGLVALLQKHGDAPANYVLRKFRDHPVVILGEPHRVREHYEFLAGLLPLLPGAGVHQVAMELFQRSSQPHIDRLLAGAEFDEPLARRIVLSVTSYFYYEELYEVLRKAWEVNRGGTRLRILGLYSRTDDPDVRRLSGMRDLLQAEIVSHAVDQAGKTLVYTGTHHAFTGYSQPALFGGKGPVRMGNYLKNRFHKAPFFIDLHYPFVKRYWLYVPLLLYRKGFCLPFGGVLDQLFQAYSSPVGFDTAHKELDLAADTFSYYAQGRRELRLSEYCDGYVYLKPLEQYRFVRPLHGIAASEEDRQILRAELGEEMQRRVFPSEAAAVTLIRRNGVTPRRLLANIDVRGLEQALPALQPLP